ncbi:tripartite tricarboxylate transporter TctB family protein [Alkalicoccus saliphilus]|uniref:DUF1468 domain-containing protein n=1 Tax=Alkalicoccus saliphilus TaxID=200989 RepID=A0A2T4U6W2_9BACI|nr:tripartite tricarboxylate transporter TctB family protein [Alkalicoccus saliphilus]PTL39131.1 hypothetical protein C6Y45_08105 [Alkalicoccus saliphilus]
MRRTTASLLFAFFIFIGCLWLIIESFSFQATARYFPLTVATLGAAFSFLVFVQTFMKDRKERQETLFHEQFGEVIKYAGWLIGYIVLINIAGFIPSTIIYMITFLYFVTQMKIHQVAVSLGGTLVFLFVLQEFVDIEWPAGMFF